MRWSEEVLLLPVEMRRVLVSLEHDAGEWEKRGLRTMSNGVGPTTAREQGLWAYAKRQACVRQDLANHFRLKWNGLDSLLMDVPLYNPKRQLNA